MKRLPLTVSLLAVWLGGCAHSLTPALPQPEAGIPTHWTESGSPPPSNRSTVAADMVNWQTFVQDATLRQFISQALTHNRDLKIAVLSIEKARAQYGVSRAEQFPSVNASLSGNHQQVARDLTQPGQARLNHSYSAGLAFSTYELDLFGRIQNLSDAALQSYLSTIEARNSQQISLIAEVIAAYLQWKADEQHLQLAHETLNSQQSSYSLIKQRAELGIGSELDIRAAETTVEAAKADIARYTAAVAQGRNALRLLIGAELPVHEGSLQATVFSEPVLQDIPQVLHSSNLLHRPDLRAAEHRLRAMNANIGAARAAYFPSITLTALLGGGSQSLTHLFSAGNNAWNFTPQFTLPIFNAGRISSAVDIALADRNIALAQYEKNIQTAFREAADALALRSTVDEQVRALLAYTDAAIATHRLNQARYQAGIASYLEVLSSQRALYAAQQTLITAQLSQQTSVVTLYKVLGGGFQRGDVPPIN